jgi:hypothetical protein
MSHIHRVVLPSQSERIVLSEAGERQSPPEDWAFLPAGDAAITRKVKAKGPTWVVRVQRGRRMISKGIWANEAHILASQKEVEFKRSTPQYARKRKNDLARREEKHQAYVNEFYSAVFSFLNFHSRYQREAKLLAEKVTLHATPVGSGTVARTERISVAGRAEAAVVAWMRHKTSGYDSMRIARIKGRRREVRKQLALKSIDILKDYRQGQEIVENCPLKRALS